ncbi:MAG: glycerophosphodiester phosphodiesterase family protein [Candidatus Auribacterota bacterium]|nr:glycerophosphodiester phosphodiesterase family protein [Candidatus Auribacterota bacterium]
MITIAHRGASADTPENTLSAFRRAVQLGADMIELDVRLSRDGKVMVFHDQDLSRTTDGTGPVEERTLEELRALDAGSWFSDEFKGEGIPTLEEVIRTILPSRIELCIEIKIDQGREYHRKRLVAGTLEIIEKTRFRNRGIPASFDRESIRISKSISPEIRTGLIFSREEVWTECAEENYSGIDYLSSRWNIITAPRVAAAHRAGRKVIAWTIDREEELNRLLPLSVDALASNNPEWLIEALKSGNQ